MPRSWKRCACFSVPTWPGFCQNPTRLPNLLSDEWGPIRVDQEDLLDGGSIWRVTFEDYSRTARAGGAPLLNIFHDATNKGTVSVKRLTEAASPVVHRVLVETPSTFEPTSSFELSLAGIVSSPISVDVSASFLQNVCSLRYKSEVF